MSAGEGATAPPPWPRDQDNSVTFSAGKTTGSVTIKGAGSSSGGSLVEHKVQLVDVKDAATILVEAVVALPRKPGEDLKLQDPVSSPLNVPPGSLIMIPLVAKTTAGQRVPLWGPDVIWTISGDKGAVELFPLDGQQPPAEGPIFSAKAVGKAKLEGKLANLGKTVTVEITVAAAAK